MKQKEKELNVDFIGGQQETLTKEEERAISEYLKNKKINTKKATYKTKRGSIKTTALTA